MDNNEVTWEEISRKLKAPFRKSELEWRPQGSPQPSKDGEVIMALTYVQSRAVFDRLDEVVGPENWTTRIVPLDGGFLCQLGLRLPGSNEWVYKEDGAAQTNIEALKGGISDAIKRAGVPWGIARYLYNLDTMWVKAGKTKAGKPKIANVKECEKRMPPWALHPDDLAELEAEATTKARPITRKQEKVLRDLIDRLDTNEAAAVLGINVRCEEAGLPPIQRIEDTPAVVFSKIVNAMQARLDEALNTQAETEARI